MLKDLADLSDVPADLLAKAEEFCAKIGLVPTKAVTPGFDVDWDDYPLLNCLDSNTASLTYELDPREGVKAYHEPKVVEIYMPFMGPTAIVSIYFLE